MATYQDSCAALALCVAANVPVVLWGAPGQGKTSVVEALALKYNLHLETVIASICEPADFGGLPVVDFSDGSVTRAPQGWAKRLADAGSGIAFYDEISTAPPAVQAALMRPILSGWVGDLQLPSSVRSIAAANPADIAADGWDLAPPMANRFCHLEWELGADTVREGFTTGWPSVQVPRIDNGALERAASDARMLVGLFLGVRPDQVTRVPTSAAGSGRAFPTPRSWEMAAKLHGASVATDSGETVATLLVAGCVGVGSAIEFLEYANNLNLPDPEEVLLAPGEFPLPDGRADMVYAVAASVWRAVESLTTTSRWLAYGEVLARIADANSSDVAYLFAKRWMACRPEGAMPPQSLMTTLGPLLSVMTPTSARR